MKWNFSLKNKLVAASALSALCLLVLFSNYIDRSHTQNVKNSISTLYEDRLIAESYILKMTSNVYQIKETINSSSDVSNKRIVINQKLSLIKEISDKYLKTKFTPLEKTKTDQFLQTVQKIDLNSSDSDKSDLETADKAIELLQELSTIQLEESKQIMAYAETLYLSGKTSSQFVFAIIVVILLVLLTIVFASKSLLPIDHSKSAHLN